MATPFALREVEGQAQRRDFPFDFALGERWVGERIKFGWSP